MTGEFILHHYSSSPFSEKIRLAFGIKKASWRSVEIPNMMPKPDLIPLTGGYRKTPVMQIGADIFCDTQIILREIERRSPRPTLFPGGQGLAYALAFWSDRIVFMPTVAVIFGRIGDMVPEAFKRDRAQMSGAAFSTEAMKAAAPTAKGQLWAHLAFLESQLADGRAFLDGAAPGASDLHAAMNVWFLKSALPDVAQELVSAFPAIGSWFGRVSAIGHGESSAMDAKEALNIARTNEPAPVRMAESSAGEFRAGDMVAVAADDYGRDAVVGTVTFIDSHEIVIAREHDAVGRVAVHFPRAGFTVARA
ncbi:MAG: glutathione S-transferase family protein [Alphaproteobacteria bacterium]|nr:glutathione S-transferase family protein [Alphaproteobacteria bacterium]